MNKWIEALKNNNLSEVKFLEASGEDVNDANESGESVLAYALRSHCDFDILMFLVEAGADKDAADSKGITATDFARKMNKKSILQLLDYDENAPKNTMHAR